MNGVMDFELETFSRRKRYFMEEENEPCLKRMTFASEQKNRRMKVPVSMKKPFFPNTGCYDFCNQINISIAAISSLSHSNSNIPTVFGFSNNHSLSGHCMENDFNTHHIYLY
ncbi:hypothetical protein H8356DRAFT_1431181 [Neocallimastix lanati (nom. inval.)]|nr:hypothetical protein H8356DRAFT_1431181 [Neocallimastix sp. JGI-2020a]